MAKLSDPQMLKSAHRRMWATGLNIGHKPVFNPVVDYESWRAGKLGHGPKVTAPRGMGEEWAARYYCERQIERAKMFAYGDHSQKQLRTGSYNHRRRHTMKLAHRQAWEYGIEIAEAVCSGIDGYWPGKKELVQEAFAYTSHMLEMAGD